MFIPAQEIALGCSLHIMLSIASTQPINFNRKIIQNNQIINYV